MNKLYQVILICYAILVVLVLIDFGDADDNSGHRHRRYLAIRNNSHFFLRLNFKANMVPWNQIFAQALGFRVNYDVPPENAHPYHHLKIKRSTMYQNLETLLDRNGLNGFHCIRRAICEIEMIRPRGIYHKILKIVFRKSKATEIWHNMTIEGCVQSITLCPLSMLEVSLYTDI